ncbi:aegerolysin family protein [Chromobacterium sphagni]|uniref:aegerolysin family protein n=1 Tax=Chromobacterium sphagni TaxID=1903179 RepID=UPI0009F2ECA0|nr:aegerolysin family protein [Chromobacterium sphagni]
MAYAQWVAITIVPDNYTVTIKNVAHSWGKFYAEGNKDEEIPASQIEGQVITEDDTYTIYACGRENASSGTEGSFDIYDGSTKVGTYTWDCPWGSKENSSNFSPAGAQPPYNRYITEPSGANLDSGALGNVTLETMKKKRQKQA